jgi:hypothetical protein
MVTVHTLIEWTAFNTDGIDLTNCQSIHILNSAIWVQDDAISIKDNCYDILVENVNVSGMGLAIGSIGHSKVNHVIFRNCNIVESAKGIYIKFRDAGTISNILFDRIYMYNVRLPIWIGPAQQSNSINPCKGNPCSLCWPSLCTAVQGSQLHNITINANQIESMILAENNESIRIQMIRAYNSPQLKTLFPFMDIPVHDPYIIAFIVCLFSIVLLTFCYK